MPEVGIHDNSRRTSNAWRRGILNRQSRGETDVRAIIVGDYDIILACVGECWIVQRQRAAGCARDRSAINTPLIGEWLAASGSHTENGAASRTFVGQAE